MPLKFQQVPLSVEDKLRLEKSFRGTDYQLLRHVIEARAIEREITMADAMRESGVYPAKGSEAETALRAAARYRHALSVLEEIAAADKPYTEKIIVT